MRADCPQIVGEWAELAVLMLYEAYFEWSCNGIAFIVYTLDRCFLSCANKQASEESGQCCGSAESWR